MFWFSRILSGGEKAENGLKNLQKDVRIKTNKNKRGKRKNAKIFLWVSKLLV
jgi:hypothetical protein